ncbi:MAG TPA: Gfo/Idh/MocA family oxidoreductase [Fibrobacteria bacterium]|nr:Gfo/Idh/MocA family oxidoreductase [Fibrobacteria bacterium]
MISAVLIGCGQISSNHVSAMLGIPDQVRLDAVCDGVAERAEALALKCEAQSGRKPIVFTDAAKMLREVKPQFVAIATGSGSHTVLANLALDTGCHVMIEKPIGLSLQDSRAVVEKARLKGLQISVCFVNRFHPHILRLKQAIDAGRLGRILHAAVQTRFNRGNSYYTDALWRGTWSQDGGALMNQCIHGIDAMQWLIGDAISRIHGVTRRFQRPIESEDFGCGIVEFRGGAVAVIEGTVNAFPSNVEERLSIFGEKGTVILSGPSLKKLETWRVEGDDEAAVLAEAGTAGPVGHVPLYKDFFASLETGGASVVGLEQGLRSLELILGLYKSMKEGRPVDFPLEDFSTVDMAGVFDPQERT